MIKKKLSFVLFDILLILLLSNPIYGNINHENNQCAQYNYSCDPAYSQPCCELNTACRLESISGSYICKQLLSEFCSSLEQCTVPNSVCLKSKCRCESDFMLIPSKQCVPTKLGQKCNYNEDCRKIYYAKCSEDKTCVCKSNYVKLNQTACAPLLGEYCWNNEQCITANSVCINHKCQCKYNYRERFDRCVPEFLEIFCNTDPHCEMIANAKCAKYNKKCVCNRGYVQYNKVACVPLLDEFCLSDQYCRFDNSICVNDKCSCQSNYVQELNDKCLPLLLGLTCKVDNDCKKIIYAKCSENNKCVCKSNYIQLGSKTCVPLIGEYCMESSDCYPTYSYCFRKRCKCADNYLRRSNNQCLSSFLGRYCDNNNDCSNVMHSICSENNECVCIANYIALNETTCAPLLNELCSNNEVCATSNAVCIDNKCQCKRHYSPQSDNYCIPEHLKGTCDCDLDCKAIKHAECSIDKKCVCKENYVSINETTCEPIKYDFCPAKEQCIVTKHYCRQNNDCDDSEHRYCSESKTCICKPTYTELNDICRTVLSGYCSKNEDCSPDNSFCYFNRCQCKYNFTAVSNDQCEPIFLGQHCKSNVNCDLIKNAKCSKEKICVCNEKTLALDKKTCVPHIGVFCLNDEECHIKDLRCLNNKCECQPNYSPISDSQCAKTTTISDCFERSNCGDPLHTNCSENKKCICKSNHIAVQNETCLPLLDSFCWKNNQCIVENSMCIDHKCQCTPGYKRVSNDLCVLIRSFYMP